MGIRYVYGPYLSPRAIGAFVSIDILRSFDPSPLPGSPKSPFLGSMFNHLFVLSLLPIASQSSFLYDRQFFQRENAAGLYPCSAYYAANMTLELLFNTINAMIYAIVTYSLIDYQSFVQAPDPFLSFLRYMGIMILLNITANVRAGSSGNSGTTTRRGDTCPFTITSPYSSSASESIHAFFQLYLHILLCLKPPSLC